MPWQSHSVRDDKFNGGEVSSNAIIPYQTSIVLSGFNKDYLKNQIMKQVLKRPDQNLHKKSVGNVPGAKKIFLLYQDISMPNNPRSLIITLRNTISDTTGKWGYLVPVNNFLS